MLNGPRVLLLPTREESRGRDAYCCRGTDRCGGSHILFCLTDVDGGKSMYVAG
jgi:hypothetical protein